MRFLDKRVSQAKEIHDTYNGKTTLIVHLKSFFAKQKKFGSRDRKEISECLFFYYRISAMVKKLTFDEAAYIGLSLSVPAKYFSERMAQTLRNIVFKEDFDSLGAKEKFDFITNHLGIKTDVKSIAEYAAPSTGVNPDHYLEQFLYKSPVFIRIRRHREKLIKELQTEGIPFTEIDSTKFQFAGQPKLTQLTGYQNGDFYIQDLASQATSNFLKAKSKSLWWDACAGAGGKSLLLLENEGIQIEASDIRKKIVAQYKLRMSQMGFQIPCQSQDFKEQPSELKERYDGILLDVPCSGSGTWSRNPEYAHFFSEVKLQGYIATQKEILKAASFYLKPGGELVFCTCSVFKAENEDQLIPLINSGQYKLLQKELIHFPDQGSDYLFIARLQLN